MILNRGVKVTRLKEKSKKIKSLTWMIDKY